jgi:hypothetical protein
MFCVQQLPYLIFYLGTSGIGIFGKQKRLCSTGYADTGSASNLRFKK